MWLVSLRSPIITETHMNRSNRLHSSSLSLCVWPHVSTICETRPYVSLSLLPLLFFLFPCPIFTFACSSQVLLSLSLCLSLSSALCSFWISFLCVFYLHPLCQVLLPLRAIWPGLCSLLSYRAESFVGFTVDFSACQILGSGSLRVSRGWGGQSSVSLPWLLTALLRLAHINAIVQHVKVWVFSSL